MKWLFTSQKLHQIEAALVSSYEKVKRHIHKSAQSN